MSSEIPVQTAIPQEPKAKQFMLVVNEISMAFLTRICPCLQFVEIEAMLMKDNETHQLLVNPIVKPVVEALPVETPAEPVADIVA